MINKGIPVVCLVDDFAIKMEIMKPARTEKGTFTAVKKKPLLPLETIELILKKRTIEHKSVRKIAKEIGGISKTRVHSILSALSS